MLFQMHGNVLPESLGVELIDFCPGEHLPTFHWLVPPPWFLPHGKEQLFLSQWDCIVELCYHRLDLLMKNIARIKKVNPCLADLAGDQQVDVFVFLELPFDLAKAHAHILGDRACVAFGVVVEIEEYLFCGFTAK